MITVRRLLGWLVGPIGAALGYGGCLRCHSNWIVAEPHSTPYAPGSSCFPLCESCWQSLSPERRLEYYEKLVLSIWQSAKSRDKWPQIKAAVLAGK